MREYEKEAHEFCEAIKKLNNNEYALENLESYLSFHFGEWLEKWARNPAEIAAEMREFAKITTYE